MSKVTAIVLAAGQGNRMNAKVAKQFLMLGGKPVLFYALKAFEDSSVDEIVIVAGKGQTEYCRENIVDCYQIKKVSRIVEGGEERFDSVQRGIMAAESADYVLIHDGARPFISKHLIENVIEQVKIVKACIVGVPVKDTIKVIDEDGIIVTTPDRNTLWAAQTPQCFEYPSIRKAYRMFLENRSITGASATDDAMIYETYLKLPVKMLKGDYNNIKLTTPEDLLLADEILKKYCLKKIKKSNNSFENENKTT
ncbi:MAG: 2-C-methyl-D-erythritol 4-phosphate cytidylyltransferase [Mobilitalea sp.]